jgi:hypothetical protein
MRVARGVSQDELFAAVNEEVGWLVGADPTSLGARRRAPRTSPSLRGAALLAGTQARAAHRPRVGAQQKADRALKKLLDAGMIERIGRGDYRIFNPRLRRHLAEQQPI